METATPLFPPLQPSGLGGNAPAGFPCRPQRTRRPGGGSGVRGALGLGAGSGRGRARRGAYLVHGERHADPVFLQQHGPAGRAPPGREAGGAPQSNKAAAQAQGRAPGALRSEPAGEAAPAVRSAPVFLPSAGEHVKVRVRVFGAPPPSSSPSSVLPERGVAKSGRDQGGRRETRWEPLRSVAPGGRSGRRIRTCPLAGRGGKKRDFRKLKRMHKSHPLDPPPKADMNLATPPSPAGLPMLMSPGTHCSRSWRC